MQVYDLQSSVPKEKDLRLQLQGQGAGVAPTLILGQGVKVTRPNTGQIVFTWADDPGAFVGYDATFGDGTSTANVKGWSVVRTNYTNTNGVYTIEVDTFNSSFNLADLPATSQLDLCFEFSWSSGR